jgi:S1-C subfamily serine protease
VGRAIALTLALLAAATAIQQSGVLKITVTVVDADGHVKPVPRHALLISDNPVSAAPQRVVTSIDGTAQARLKPGNYTIESDEPLIFLGKAYAWTQTLDVPGGRDTVLELTAANAEVGTPVAVRGGGAEPGSASALLIDWQDSVVSIWSPTQLGSGFVIDTRGLIATNQRLVGKATDVEVQLSPSKKVPARVVAADATKDVAILRIDPAAITHARAMTLSYSKTVNEKEKLYALEAPLDDRRSLASAIVSKVTAHSVVTNVSLDERSAGVPLINAAGEVVAITTTSDDGHAIHDIAPAAIRIDEARAVIAEAVKEIDSSAPPAATPLPVEPEHPFDDDALGEAARKRSGSVSAYQVSAADFDVSVVTPVMLYGMRHREERSAGRGRGAGAGPPAGNREALLKGIRALQEFANWEDYVYDYPPVVMIRATPKLVENFWTSLGRTAAQTQGVDISALKHLKAPFARMQVSCGDADVTPIHPFLIERRVGEREYVYEGLYVFAPDAIGPHCGTVKLTLYSGRPLDKGDVHTIDAKIVQQVWDDFAPYRAARR